MSQVEVNERCLTGEILLKSIRVDEEGNKPMTLSVVATTDAPVRRFDYETGKEFNEVLDVQESSVNTQRLKAGLPVLNSHQREKLSDVIGVTTGYKFKDGQLLLDMKLSADPELDTLKQNIRDGILTNVSIGYSVERFEEEVGIEDEKQKVDDEADDEDGVIEEAEIKTMRATEWSVLELSLVPIPADASARITDVRKRTVPYNKQTETAMSTKDIQPNQADVQPSERAELDKMAEQYTADLKAVKEESAQLKLRDLEIRENTKKLGLSQDFTDELLANEALDIHQARQLCIEAKVKLESKDGISVVSAAPSDHNPQDNFQKGMEAAIEVKVKQDQTSFIVDEKVIERAKPFINSPNGFFDNLVRKHMVEVQGADIQQVRDLNKLQVVDHMLGQRAIGGIGSTDLPFSLANVLDKVLRQLYLLTPRTYMELVKKTTLNNFKIHPRIMNEPSTGLYKIDETLTPEGGAPSIGTIREFQNTIQLETYTRNMFITRRALIDDDMGVFSRIPQVAAQDIILLESQLVYNIFNNNITLGSDSTDLFHADHGNLNTSNSLSLTTAVNTAKTAMEAQTNLAGKPIQNEPNILLIPNALELDARIFVTRLAQLNLATEIAVAIEAQNLTMVRTPFLSAAQGGSDTDWFMVNNVQKDMLIELATLDTTSGMNASIYSEVIVGEGIKYKILHDAAVSAMDYRPYSKNEA